MEICEDLSELLSGGLCWPLTLLMTRFKDSDDWNLDGSPCLLGGNRSLFLELFELVEFILFALLRLTAEKESLAELLEILFLVLEDPRFRSYGVFASPGFPYPGYWLFKVHKDFLLSCLFVAFSEPSTFSIFNCVFRSFGTSSSTRIEYFSFESLESEMESYSSIEPTSLSSMG